MGSTRWECDRPSGLYTLRGTDGEVLASVNRTVHVRPRGGTTYVRWQVVTPRGEASCLKLKTALKVAESAVGL